MNFLEAIISNQLLTAVIVLSIVAIVLLIIVIMMHFKLKKFLISIDGKNISDSLTFVSSNLNDLQAFRTELEKYLSQVEKRLRKSVQSVHTVRFNPFKGTGGGGNQSFSTTFVNEDGDGVIISSLYSREHVSIFSKPVKKHASEYELSEEEKESLEGAKIKLKG